MNSDEERRRELYSLLGVLPSRTRPVKAQQISRELADTYVLEKLVLDLNGIEPVPAYFSKPLNADGPVPVVLYNHAHGGAYDIGKDELIEGRKALQPPPYAEALSHAGYGALCIDTWLFGERRGRDELDLFKEMLWQGRILWGMMVDDSLRALDYLETREDVDAHRIATLGLSMGSTMAWWVAGLDQRVKVCVDLCCLTDFHALMDTNGLSGHGIYYFVPNLLLHFTTAEINALIAPRPHLSLAGRHDRLTPVAGLDRIDRSMKTTYRAKAAAECWQLKTYGVGHMETAAMRHEVMRFLEQWL